MPPTPPPTFRSFATENGYLLLATKVVGAALRRPRDILLASRLHASGLRIGRSPRLLGLAHMRLGANLSAGDDLWLEVVTHFAGETFDPLLILGDDCNLSDRVHIACANQISIGSGLLCGSGVLITDHSHGIYSGPASTAGAVDGSVPDHSSPELRPNLRPLSHSGTVCIGNNVWIGDGAAVLPGAEIGDGAILGAHSVVTGRIPARTVAVGSPARPIRRWDPGSQQWVRLE